jgi:hypothetical protein
MAKTPKFVADWSNQYSPIVKALSVLDQQSVDNAKPIYIYNTYVQPHTIGMGNLGSVYLKGVDTKKSTNPDDWEQYVMAYETKDRVISYDRVKQGQEVVYEQLDGWIFVKDIMKSSDKDRNKNLEFWGVFASANNPPSAKELAAAKEKLTQNLAMIVQEADGLWRGSREDQGRINRRHRDAASYLKLEREWNIRPEYFTNCGY